MFALARDCPWVKAEDMRLNLSYEDSGGNRLMRDDVEFTIQAFVSNR